MSALDRVQMSDLDEEQQQVAELIGLDNYKRLVSVFGGLSIYIPKADAWERMARDEQIREEFDGYNFKELAGRYGLTEVRIRSMISFTEYPCTNATPAADAAGHIELQ